MLCPNAREMLILLEGVLILLEQILMPSMQAIVIVGAVLIICGRRYIGSTGALLGTLTCTLKVPILFY